jgi:uracil-DNA glycosylase family 4
MPDSIRQILTDTRELLCFLQETGLAGLPASPQLQKFLAGDAKEPAPAPPPQPASRSARPAPPNASPGLQPADVPPGPQPLAVLDRELADCRLCPLHLGRERIVPGSGSGRAGLLLIEDQPGAEEEAAASPFGGESGELLDKMLKAIDLKREEVYLTSLVKCRPPEDRDPSGAEVSACQNFLARQIAAVNPAVICVMGQHAAHLLTGSDLPLFRMRGRFYDFHGTPLLVSFHPRFLLRNPEMKKASWQDLQNLRKKLLLTGR